MAILPSALAIATIRFGGYCHAERVPGLYEWGCMFPVTIVMASIAFLLVVPVAMLAQRASIRLAPVGWLVVPVAGGLAMQAWFVAYMIFSAGDGVMPMSIAELLGLPWPFAAGAVAAGAYWTVLHTRRTLVS